MNAKVSKMIPMPAILLLCASLSRPGLSPLRSISNVCAALYELIKENYRAMCEDASVQGASEIGSVVATGANSGGPVVTTSILPFSFRGLIQ